MASELKEQGGARQWLREGDDVFGEASTAAVLTRDANASFQLLAVSNKSELHSFNSSNKLRIKVLATWLALDHN